MRTCGTCGEEKPLRRFPQARDKAKGRAHVCLQCRGIANRRAYAERGRPDRPLPARLIADGRSPPSSFFDVLRLRCPRCRCWEELRVYGRELDSGRTVPMACFAWTCRSRRCGERWAVVVLGAVVEIVWLDLPAGVRADGEYALLAWANARAAERRRLRDLGERAEFAPVSTNPLRVPARFGQDPRTPAV